MDKKNEDNLRRNTAANFGVAAFETGANPDFVVTSATRNAREMERLVERLQVKDKLLDRRLADFEQLKEAARVPERVEDPDPVLIEGDSPDVEAKAK